MDLYNSITFSETNLDTENNNNFSYRNGILRNANGPGNHIYIDNNEKFLLHL